MTLLESVGAGHKTNIRRRGSRRWAAAALTALLGLAALALYWRTMARTITWLHRGGDGPELSAAAATLGIAHPPGYPLFMLLGHLFSLIPVGEVAFRVGLLSAVSAALGVALAAAVTRQLLHRQLLHPTLRTQLPAPNPRAPTPNTQRSALLGSAAAGVALATSPLLWSQATIPEVYALNAAIVLAALSMVVAWQPGRDRLVVGLALLFGIGLGDHTTLALLIGPTAIYLILRDPGLLRRPALPVACAAALLGLSLYVYLPLRAAADPALNWGDPSEPGRFLAHVTASAYRGYFGARPLSDVLARLPAAARLIGEQLTWPGLLLALIGFGELARVRPGLARLLGAYIAITVVFSLFYFADNGEVYLMPAALALAPCLGSGVAHLAGNGGEPKGQAGGTSLLPSGGGRFVAVLALVIGMAGWQMWSLWPAMDVSSDRAAEVYVRETLASQAPNTILTTDSDDQTLALWYGQVIWGLRPDVVVVDTRLVASSPWFQGQLEQRHPGVLKRVLP